MYSMALDADACKCVVRYASTCLMLFGACHVSVFISLSSPRFTAPEPASVVSLYYGRMIPADTTFKLSQLP